MKYMKTKLVSVVSVVAVLLVAGYVAWRSPSASSPVTQTTQAMVDLKNGGTYTLTAAPAPHTIGDTSYPMLAYNGTIPGPVIRVQKGSTITLNVDNELGFDTTLHAHGVRMDNAFDGVPNVTQKSIKTGSTFAYTLKFPDAGVFWYHPHVATSQTVQNGLYGMIIVEDGPVPANQEVPLVVSDILIGDHGIVPFPSSGINYTLMGRYGNTMLVNGETNWRMNTHPGEVVRFYITDAANARTFELSIPGAKLKLVGSDGGKYQQEVFVDSVLVSPGERATVDAYFEKAGAYTLTHTTPNTTYKLGTITVAGDQAAQSFASQFAQAQTHDIGVTDARIQHLLAKQPDKTLRITMNMQMGAGMGRHMMENGSMMGGSMAGMMDGSMHGGGSGGIEWEDTMSAMNAASTDSTIKWSLLDEATGKTNLNIDDWVFKQGTIAKIRIYNDPHTMHPMQHPIHFHGQRFLVLAVNGVPNTDLVWKDTVLVPAGDTVDLAVDMSNPGTWMAHCHILEHADDGMMLSFKVQ